MGKQRLHWYLVELARSTVKFLRFLSLSDVSCLYYERLTLKSTLKVIFGPLQIVGKNNNEDISEVCHEIPTFSFSA